MRFLSTHTWLIAALAGLAILAGYHGKTAASERPVKEFYISIAETAHEFYPGGPKVQAWAFNGQVPGPTLRVTEGDLVRVHFSNKHYTNHTLHFHGLNVPNEMDGVA
jgi:manganese oxidase